ncbi:hypothetical protein JMF94_05245 [Desulfovibrio sp. UIB00]|uniref:hypothetical protein n=1 Tax=Desulfovibrio sp. UIB00 TaxID=2804314 RepID=UPI001F0FB35C|nr:hypothetical protein [Desulfovibrio sp. UIB00]MCH5144486.1 hypothetical protein [Desulfovibrio sp. UIB00]
MHKLDGASPTKLLKVFYIQWKYRSLSSETLTRKSMGGLANVIGCHPGAANLDFEGDSVQIPAKQAFCKQPDTFGDSL